MTTIRRATSNDSDACIAVLASLPNFFTPDTHAEARAALDEHPCWVALETDSITGFLIAESRSHASAEITYAAVVPQLHRHGIGAGLVAHAFEHLREQGVTLVEVKTLDESSGYEPYVATRAFWERMGFVQVDCIDPLPGWQPGNPSAIYVAAIAATLRAGDPRTAPTRDPRPGFHSVTPRIVVDDVEAQVAFLRDVFDARGDVTEGRPAEILVGDSLIMVTAATQRDYFPAFLYVYVDDADDRYDKALRAGATSLEPPLDTPYGDRRAMVRDPHGNIFQIAHQGRRH